MPYARMIADLLLTKYSFDEICRKLEQKLAKSYILCLLKSKSEFNSFDPKSIGVNITSELIYQSLQDSLDVKHNKKNNKHVKLDVLHSHQTKIGFRVYDEFNCLENNFTFNVSFDMTFEITKLANQVYFIFAELKKTNHVKLFNILSNLFIIIYCDDLVLFLNHKPTFISNYVKYMYCQLTGSLIPNPRTLDQKKLISNLYFFSFLFNETKNLNLINPDASNVLMSIHAQDGKNRLKQNKNVQYLFGNKAQLGMGEPLNIGAGTTYSALVVSHPTDLLK